MGHDHSARESTANLGVALLLNVAFTIIELIGGLWTNSVAILSDALHDLGDSLSLLVAWYLERLSHQGRNATFTFGYRRFNTLGALITGLVLVVGSIVVIYEAIKRLWAPEAVYVPGMIGLAVLGVCINGIAAWRVWRGQRSLNEQMVAWHLFEDVAGWVVVLAGSIAMYFWHLPWLDALLSLGITIFILVNVVVRLYKALRVFLQAAPEEVDIEDIRGALIQLPVIRDVHHVHLWTLDGKYHVATFHVVVPSTLSIGQWCDLRKTIRDQLKGLGIDHITVEFEPQGRPCVAEEDGL